MYLEKEALEYFRKYDILSSLLVPFQSNHNGEIYSRRIGRNLEFEQYREYTAGDNLKDIDWKVFARSNKLFVKNYGSDINTRIRIIIDNSLSMNYPAGNNSKLEIAKKIAALFSYLLISQKNSVYLSTINQEYRDLDKIIAKDQESIFDKITPEGTTLLNKIIPSKRKEMTFLLSDGWWNNEPFANHLSFIIKNRIHWIHLFSPEEINFQLTGNLEIKDIETGDIISIIPSEIRRSYTRKVKERINLARKKLSEAQLLYSVFSLDKKYYVSLKEMFEFSKNIIHERRRR